MSVVVLVVGGMLALQSSNSLDATKVVYLLAASAALLGVLANLKWWVRPERIAIAGPWIVFAIAFAALLAISIVTARAHGTSATSWLRDAAAYGLFAVAPLFGLACARTASRRWIMGALVACGVLAIISFADSWLGRRLILDIPIERIVLPTSGLRSALLALATAAALAGGKRRFPWAALAGLVLGLFFVTGTRSTLLLLLVPIWGGLIAGRPWRRAAGTLTAEIAVAVAIFVLADIGISAANGAVHFDFWQSHPNTSVAGTETRQLNERVAGVGTLLTDPGSDQSFQDRWTQTKLAWNTFIANPAIGVGPGYGFVWTRTGGGETDAFTMDTPLIYLAKFGLLGLVPLLIFLVAYFRLARALWRKAGARIEFLAIGSYGGALLVATALGAPMEDKGVSFALLFLVGFGCRALINEDPTEPSAGTGGEIAVGDAPNTSIGAPSATASLEAGTGAAQAVAARLVDAVSKPIATSRVYYGSSMRTSAKA